jgi:hypothetical protein
MAPAAIWHKRCEVIPAPQGFLAPYKKELEERERIALRKKSYKVDRTGVRSVTFGVKLKKEEK